MGEPSFAVPLSALVDIEPNPNGDEDNPWVWSCRFEGMLKCSIGHYFPSRAEAESAAITHLADVHGLTPLVEETGDGTARKLIEIAEHVRDAIRHRHRYDHLDQEAIDDLGESSRQLRLIAAEVARLRSAGDGAADVERLRGIERAAAAYIRSCLCNGGTEAPELVADIQEKWAALHDALGADR